MEHLLFGERLEQFIDSSLIALESVLKINYKKHKNNKYLNKSLADYLINLFVNESAGEYVYRKKNEELNKDYEITPVLIKLLTKVAQNAYEAGLASKLTSEEGLTFLKNLYWSNIFGTKFGSEQGIKRMTAHFYLHAGEVARKLFNKTKSDVWFKRSLESSINYLKLSINDESEYETRRVILNYLSNITQAYYKLNKKEHATYAYGQLFFNLIQLPYESLRTINHELINKKIIRLYSQLNKDEGLRIINKHNLDLLLSLLPENKGVITPVILNKAKNDLSGALRELINEL